MSFRGRPTTTTLPIITIDNVLDSPKLRPPPPSLSQRAISQTLTSTAQLANLLPTGTLLALQIFTNNDSCDSATRPMTLFLLAFLALACFLASFTDSFKTSDIQVFYGFAIFKGMWLFDYRTAAASGIPELSKYKLKRVLDIVLIGLGLICSFLFVIIPTKRHGIGYPVTPGN